MNLIHGHNVNVRGSVERKFFFIMCTEKLLTIRPEMSANKVAYTVSFD